MPSFCAALLKSDCLSAGRLGKKNSMQLMGNVRERRRGNEETDIIAGNLGGIAYDVFLLIQDRSDETASGTDRSEENFQKG